MGSDGVAVVRRSGRRGRFAPTDHTKPLAALIFILFVNFLNVPNASAKNKNQSGKKGSVLWKYIPKMCESPSLSHIT